VSVVSRMEERLHVEHRRNPETCNSSLFPNDHQPLLEKYVNECKDVGQDDPMPQSMRFFATSFSPPMALGAISGEVQKMGWMLQVAVLDLANPTVEFLSREYRGYLKVDLDLFMRAVERFDETIPQLSPEQQSEFRALGPPDSESLEVLGHVLPLSLDEERSVLQNILAESQTVADALRRQTILMHYYYKVLLPRRNRIVFYVRSLHSLDDVQCQAMRSDSTSILRAFRLMLHPPPVPSVRVHEALLELATGGWQSRYYHVNLQRIREQIFKWERATVDDFKAFLLALKMFGEEISISGA